MRKWVDSLAELGVDDRLFIPAINRLDAYKGAKALTAIVENLPLDDETTIIHVSSRLRDRKWWIVAQRIPVEQNTAFIKRSSGKIERHTAEPPRDVSRMFRLMKRSGRLFESALLLAKTDLEKDFVRRLYGKRSSKSGSVYKVKEDGSSLASPPGSKKDRLH